MTPFVPESTSPLDREDQYQDRATGDIIKALSAEGNREWPQTK
jgi:hypothetical protein